MMSMINKFLQSAWLDRHGPKIGLAASKALASLVMNYSRDGVGIPDIINGEEISIIGVSRGKLEMNHG